MKKIFLFLIMIFICSTSVNAIEDEDYNYNQKAYDTYNVSIKTNFVNIGDISKIGDIDFYIYDNANNKYDFILTAKRKYVENIQNISFGQDIVYGFDLKNKEYKISYKDNIVENTVNITLTITGNSQVNGTTTYAITSDNKENDVKETSFLDEMKYYLLYGVLCVIGGILLIFIIVTIAKIKKSNS